MEARKPILSWVASAARWTVGAIFVVAAILKIGDPATFQGDILSFRIVGYPAAYIIAYILPWIELLAGVAVIAGRWGCRGGMVLTAGMLVAFIGGAAYAWALGYDIHCGCFGGSETDETTNYTLLIGRNLLMLAGIVLAAYWERRFHPTK